MPETVSMLCIDDDHDALSFLNSLLTLQFPSAVIYTASDGEAGLRVFAEQRPKIVITDLSMPRMDGTALAGRIRAIEPETSIVVISAHSCAEMRQSSSNHFDHYLLKPLDFRELVRTVEGILSANTVLSQLPAT